MVLIYFLHLLLKRNAQGFAAIDSATNRKEMLGALGKDRAGAESEPSVRRGGASLGGRGRKDSDVRPSLAT